MCQSKFDWEASCPIGMNGNKIKNSDWERSVKWDIMSSFSTSRLNIFTVTREQVLIGSCKRWSAQHFQLSKHVTDWDEADDFLPLWWLNSGGWPPLSSTIPAERKQPRDDRTLHPWRSFGRHVSSHAELIILEKTMIQYLSRLHERFMNKYECDLLVNKKKFKTDQQHLLACV